MDLQIWVKQSQLFNAIGQPVVYIGNNPQTMVAVVGGTLPVNRQFPNYPGYVDFTPYVSDLFKLELLWTAERNDAGEVIPGATQVEKRTSGTLTFEAEGYRIIKKWLADDVSAPFNCIDVKIVHVGCVDYLDYQIKAVDVTFCESNPQLCTLDVVLKQKNEVYNCIQQTMINDNWQGWFQERPQGGKKHPRFSYCNELKPNGMLVGLWYLMSFVVSIMTPLLLIFGAIGFVVNTVINAIIATINAIINFLNSLGFNWNTLTPVNIPTFQDIREGIANVYIETAGCGREHPAPLIRDYIKNVCDKCGVSVDQTTAPLFFATNMQVETNSRGVVNIENPHYKACYLHAENERGIKRRKTLSLTGAANNTDYYVEGNSPNIFLDVFLDKLKALYNFEWRVKGNKLYIQRKDYFQTSAPLYDFRDSSPDRLKLLEGICFDWNEIKNPAYTEGIYQTDVMDKPGNEAKRYMNDLVSHGSNINNPNFDGKREIRTEFGATRFRLDGVQEDYIYDALQITLLFPFINLAQVFMALYVGAIKSAMADFADYALLLNGETAQLPKVIIWDGASYNNAKAIKKYSAAPIANYGMPAINTNYNQQPWYDKNTPKTEVRGAAITLPPFYPGYYTVTGFFGAFEIKQPALLVNYPMYFQSGYQDNLYDWFHWIDDPAKNPRERKSFTARIQLCCEDLIKLKVYNDANEIALGQKIKINSPFYQDAIIKEIRVSYDPGNELGQYIEIKGTL